MLFGCPPNQLTGRVGESRNERQADEIYFVRCSFPNEECVILAELAAVGAIELAMVGELMLTTRVTDALIERICLVLRATANSITGITRAWPEFVRFRKGWDILEPGHWY